MNTRILIFDDNPCVRSLLAFSLKKRGYRVETYEKADDWISSEMQKSWIADVVITDAHMPGTSGLELLRTLTQRGYRSAQMAIMSGAWREQELRQATKLGCQTFTKPIRIPDLVKWVVDSVHGAQA